MNHNKVRDLLFGLSIGDALGVPVEFMERRELKNDPVHGLRGYGVWNQPPGTWSDDSSLSFCLADSLSKGYNLDNIASNFVKWLQEAYWTAHHEVFDVGNATRNAITRLKKSESPLYSGEFDENSNGNGSLMRISPLIFYIYNKSIEERFKYVKEVSSITHAHFRSVFSCFIYLEFLRGLINKLDKIEAYKSMQVVVNDFLISRDFNPEEIKLFSRILNEDISELNENLIYSSGYVLHSLEASLWCLLNSGSYAETVLKAVNLGEDTDTSGAIAGALAGVYYGSDNIPAEWINGLVRRDDILALANRLNDSSFF